MRQVTPPLSALRQAPRCFQARGDGGGGRRATCPYVRSQRDPLPRCCPRVSEGLCPARNLGPRPTWGPRPAQVKAGAGVADGQFARLWRSLGP